MTHEAAALAALNLNASQILAALGAGTLTVNDLVIGSTVACEAGHMTSADRDQLVAIALAWRDGVH